MVYLCDTGICHSVWVASGLQVGFMYESITTYCHITLVMIRERRRGGRAPRVFNFTNRR